jgi:hypothetical protein
MERASSKLFVDCFSRRPALHNEIETKVRETFREIGGPELRPIIAEALPLFDFEQVVRSFAPESESGIDCSDRAFFTNPDIVGGQLQWGFYYNIGPLNKSGSRVSDLMLFQITSTFYGDWLACLKNNEISRKAFR